jgi:hypothetical protein
VPDSAAEPDPMRNLKKTDEKIETEKMLLPISY